MEFSLEGSLHILRQTPPALQAWLAEIPDEWTGATDGDETWSAFDIVGHLIHSERSNYIPRARVILSNEEHREFEPFDRFAMFGASRGKSLGELLQTFQELRAQSLAKLAEMNLSEADLDRTGIHPALGEVTLRQLLSSWVVHDLNHLAQIAEVMARQYRQAVGPWKVYLDILGKEGS